VLLLPLPTEEGRGEEKGYYKRRLFSAIGIFLTALDLEELLGMKVVVVSEAGMQERLHPYVEKEIPL